MHLSQGMKTSNAQPLPKPKVPNPSIQPDREQRPQIYPVKSPEVVPSTNNPEIVPSSPNTEIMPGSSPEITPQQPSEIPPIEE